MPYYAVARGKTVGIFSTWNECKEQVHKFENARYKKFNDEASAESFINEHRVPDGLDVKVKQDPISFPTSSSTVMKTKAKVSSSVSTTDTTGIPVPAQPPLKRFKPSVAQRSDKSNVNPWMKLARKTLIPATATPMATAPTTAADPNANRMRNDKRKLAVKDDRVMFPVVAPKRKKFVADFKNDAVDLSSFTVDDQGYVVVYTDGACKSNGKRGATAGIGVWFGDNHHMNISRPVEGNRRTNNTAEIQAAEKAILKAKEAGIDKLTIRTDSQFTINCITVWIEGWRRQGWKLSDGKPVKNRVDLEKLSKVMEDVQVKWSYVKGHAGHYGNEQADRLAVAGCDYSVPIY